MHFDPVASSSLKSEIDFTANEHIHPFAMACTSLSGEVRRLISSSLSEATRRAYSADLADFLEWGGTIPSTDGVIAEYIADQAKIAKSATISRRLAALSKAHAALGGQNPVRSELVKATMRGIRRTLGVAQREAKPLLKEDLFEVLDGTGSGLKDVRDRALLLVGFAGGFRRSELVGLNFEDVEHVRHGVVVKLHKTKTDQESRGREVGIPFGRGRWCPVRALGEWVSVSGVTQGAIFRSLNKHDQIRDRMSGEAVSLVVKKRTGEIGKDCSLFSGHSLRAGFVTSAAIAGASSHAIRLQTGHASDAMLSRYIRKADLFRNNAAEALL